MAARPSPFRRAVDAGEMRAPFAPTLRKWEKYIFVPPLGMQLECETLWITAWVVHAGMNTRLRWGAGLNRREGMPLDNLSHHVVAHPERVLLVAPAGGDSEDVVACMQMYPCNAVALQLQFTTTCGAIVSTGPLYLGEDMPTDPDAAPTCIHLQVAPLGGDDGDIHPHYSDSSTPSPSMGAGPGVVMLAADVGQIEPRMPTDAARYATGLSPIDGSDDTDNTKECFAYINGPIHDWLHACNLEQAARSARGLPPGGAEVATAYASVLA